MVQEDDIKQKPSSSLSNQYDSQTQKQHKNSAKYQQLQFGLFAKFHSAVKHPDIYPLELSNYCFRSQVETPTNQPLYIAMASTKTVAFMGASTGIGLATLKHTLAAGHQCVALCRTPSKLTEILPPASNPNLRVIPGNAHDIDTVSELLRKDDGTLVDIVVSTIGNKPDLSGMINADPRRCHPLPCPTETLSLRSFWTSSPSQSSHHRR